jgi:hypothetical protein
MKARRGNRTIAGADRSAVANQTGVTELFLLCTTDDEYRLSAGRLRGSRTQEKPLGSLQKTVDLVLDQSTRACVARTCPIADSIKAAGDGGVWQ